MMNAKIAALLAVLLIAVCLWSEEIPVQLEYQGKLTDIEGVGMNGDYDITFTIYDEAESGIALWTENHDGSDAPKVAIGNGLFSVILGTGVPMTDLDFSIAYYLELTVESSSLSPRNRLVPAPYAMHALNGGTLQKAYQGGNTILMNDAEGDIRIYNDDVIPREMLFLRESNGCVGIGTDNPEFQFTQKYESFPATFTNDAGDFAYMLKESAGEANILGFAAQTSPPTSIIMANSSYDLSLGTNGAIRMTIDCVGYVGIGTTEPTVRLHVQTTHDAPTVVFEKIGGNEWNYIMFRDDGTNEWAIGTESTSDFAIGAYNPDWEQWLTILKITGNVGIGTETPNEKLTIDGRLSLSETTAPAITAGYGKLYVKSADSKLYFRDDSGIEYDLISSVGSATYTEQWQEISPGADAIWTDVELSSYGISSGDICEIVFICGGAAMEAGVRTNGSVLERKVNIPANGQFTLQVIPEGASATIELYEQEDAGVTTYISGYLH